MALQYMTPVMYGVDMVENSGAGDWLILIFNLNPMTPIIKSIQTDYLLWTSSRTWFAGSCINNRYCIYSCRRSSV